MSDLQPTNCPSQIDRRKLSLFDGICIIVGTIIGAGIFKTPGEVAGKLDGIEWVIGIWILGGGIALIGALCFAQLGSIYQQPGGDYAYLKQGYHKRIGFAFSWAAFWIIRPGNIGAMAMIFGEYAQKILPISRAGVLVYGVGIVMVLSATNLLGVLFGKTTQNILTVAKVIGILMIVFTALLLPDVPSSSPTRLDQDHLVPAVSISAAGAGETTEASNSSENLSDSAWASFWLAMVYVMFAYGGWNDISFVATEIRNPQKNLLRSLVLGTCLVTVIYLLVNIALSISLSYDVFSSPHEHQSATSILVSQKMGGMGVSLLAVLVCVSSAGAVNGMIFTSPRIYQATALDYPGLRWLTGSQSPGAENQRGWSRAMVCQMFVAGSLIVVCGQAAGPSASAFNTILFATATYFWLFLGMTVACLLIRPAPSQSDCQSDVTPFRTPLFPLLPILFVSACVFMCYQSFAFMMQNQLWIPTILIGVLMIAGILISFILDTDHD